MNSYAVSTHEDKQALISMVKERKSYVPVGSIVEHKDKKGKVTYLQIVVWHEDE